MLAVAVAALLPLSGCGLVFQGTTQTLRLSTSPEGAAIEFHEVQAISPATLTLSRRVKSDTVFRAARDGHQPACSVNDCGPPKWIKVLDSLPAALPLAVDAIAGTLGYCDNAALTLEPIRWPDITFKLPSNEQILKNPGMCFFPYLYDEEFKAKAQRIIVSTGALQQRYSILGNVDFGRLGFERTNSGAVAIRGVIVAWATREFSKATPAEINTMLRARSLYEYGNQVDALINVNYQSDPANNVFATAVAVHFENTAHDGTSASSRLGELERLRKDGLIDQREYEQKRAEILRGL